MSLGEKIKELRESKGLTQEELGKILNVSKPSISRYEANTNEPNTETLKQLARYFNVSIDYLLGFPDKTTVKLIRIDDKYPNVADVEEAMRIIMTQPGLMLKGELLTDEDKIILANSIQNGLRLAEELKKKRKEKNIKSE